MKTIATKTVRGRKYSYILKSDDQGYYWDGMEHASWRRKTRDSAEKHAARCHCDIIDTEDIEALCP